MNGFTLLLRDSSSVTRLENVHSFLGEDASGSFGILAGHARFMTCLNFGLARFRLAADPWQYLAMPGAVLYFADNCLNLSTRRYFLDRDYERITEALSRQLLAEEESLQDVKKSLAQLEQEVLKRMWRLGQDGFRP
ncbi:MAG: F0F1 ATP synthase subunit epsilon [Methylococcaceae bacterium]|nr:F0F1 ATP synthase subunit epsilon [Methylococcaceae bacterium]